MSRGEGHVVKPKDDFDQANHRSDDSLANSRDITPEDFSQTSSVASKSEMPQVGAKRLNQRSAFRLFGQPDRFLTFHQRLFRSSNRAREEAERFTGLRITDPMNHQHDMFRRNRLRVRHPWP